MNWLAPAISAALASGTQFAVVLRATGQLIGDCAAMTRADDPGQCEIGFTIAPRYQGRGYATEAVRLLVGYLLARGKHRITACCDPRNTASAAVPERLAMRREGHLPSPRFPGSPPCKACAPGAPQPGRRF